MQEAESEYLSLVVVRMIHEVEGDAATDELCGLHFDRELNSQHDRACPGAGDLNEAKNSPQSLAAVQLTLASLLKHRFYVCRPGSRGQKQCVGEVEIAVDGIEENEVR